MKILRELQFFIEIEPIKSVSQKLKWPMDNTKEECFEHVGDIWLTRMQINANSFGSEC